MCRSCHFFSLLRQTSSSILVKMMTQTGNARKRGSSKRCLTSNDDPNLHAPTELSESAQRVWGGIATNKRIINSNGGNINWCNRNSNTSNLSIKFVTITSRNSPGSRWALISWSVCTVVYVSLFNIPLRLIAHWLANMVARWPARLTARWWHVRWQLYVLVLWHVGWLVPWHIDMGMFDGTLTGTFYCIGTGYPGGIVCWQVVCLVPW